MHGTTQGSDYPFLGYYGRRRPRECGACGIGLPVLPRISREPGADYRYHVGIFLAPPWSARLRGASRRFVPYIEGEATRRGDGIYDRMRPIGAHEVLVENSSHERHLWNASDSELEQFLLLAAQRVQDLKGDGRFKYVSIFKDHGTSAGQEFQHPTSQLTATTFVPRRVLYELRAAREYFESKERCVFCDIISQEIKQDLRVIEIRGDFIAVCRP